MSSLATAADVLAFWNEAGPQAWFRKDDAFDAAFRGRFEATHHAAARRELDHWMDQPHSALALLIVLDQLPRNAYRGTAHMFATDPLALHFAKQAIERGFDRQVEPALRAFLLMPLMHSEALADQELLLTLLDPNSEKLTYEYAVIHRDVIAQFGRFPHRNLQFARTTTAAEQAFLDRGGFSG